MKYSNWDNMLKSALKKQNLVSIGDKRHVTFCKTVQIYGNSLKPDEKLISFESPANIGHITFESLFNKYVEPPELFDCNSIDDPSDFLVHKVVYDEDHLNSSDSSEDLKNAEDEANDHDSDGENEFVVHQVVQPSDDVLDEVSEDGSENSIRGNGDEENGVVCELSVQNIEQHNKLTDSQFLLEVESADSPLIMASLENSDIILSPPLQELGVNRLICPQTDEWFWNLDISPLNSVQETDSESNISSEDTMIMMTSEESARNEQKIQESLQKFESLKKQTAAAIQESELEKHSLITVTSKVQDSDSSKNCNDMASFVSESELFEIPEFNSLKINNTEVIFKKLEPIVPEDSIHNKGLCDTINSCAAMSLEEKIAADFSLHRGRLNSWDKDLTAVEIPNDVREWKICINKENLTKLSNTNGKNSFAEVDLSHVIKSELNEVPLSAENYVSEPCVDELEHFVDQCTERVERIRKRYSINETMLWTPRRGIRPRFGSSAEILQHMPNGNHLLLSCTANTNSNSHYSWPYYISADQQEENQLRIPNSDGFLTNFLNNLPHTSLPELDSHYCPQPPVDQFEHFVKDNCTSYAPATNELSSSLPPFHERGTPEGASPPRLSSESLCDYEKLELSENIVYYSMNV